MRSLWPGTPTAASKQQPRCNNDCLTDKTAQPCPCEAWEEGYPPFAHISKFSCARYLCVQLLFACRTPTRGKCCFMMLLTEPRSCRSPATHSRTGQIKTDAHCDTAEAD
jgi:hypothetical protein